MLNILNISGKIVLAVMSIFQYRKRISYEDSFIPAEAEIIIMNYFNSAYKSASDYTLFYGRG